MYVPTRLKLGREGPFPLVLRDNRVMYSGNTLI